MRRIPARIASLAVGVLAMCVGCTSVDWGPQEIDHLELQAPPAAVNLDATPGPDGVRARVLFGQRGKVIVPREGLLELRLYEGPPTAGTSSARRPLKVWTFDVAEIGTNQAKVHGLTCYYFSLPWGARVPTTSPVTLIAKYTAPNGNTVVSAPVTIGLGAM